MSLNRANAKNVDMCVYTEIEHTLAVLEIQQGNGTCFHPLRTRLPPNRLPPNASQQ